MTCVSAIYKIIMFTIYKYFCEQLNTMRGRRVQLHHFGEIKINQFIANATAFIESIS